MTDDGIAWLLLIGGAWSMLVGAQVRRGRWLRLVRGNLLGGRDADLRAGGMKAWGWFYIGVGVLCELLLVGQWWFGWR